MIRSPITGWSKDRFLVAAGHPGRLLCPSNPPSPIPYRTNDALVGPALARQWPGRFVTEDSDLAFDADDIICTDSLALVNDELHDKNAGDADWLRSVEKLTGKRAVWLKGSPAHHIGMFVAPLDDHRAVVGDPDLGAKYGPKSPPRRSAS